MYKEIMHKDDILNNDNIGNVLVNLSEIVNDINGLRFILAPFNDPEKDDLIPHIIRSLESFASDIDDIHTYLDRMCINTVRHERLEAVRCQEEFAAGESA